MLADGKLEAARAARYAGWDAPAAQAMLGSDLGAIAARVEAENINPQPRSGRQERLENLVNRYL
jgi:xylose isomerase